MKPNELLKIVMLARRAPLANMDEAEAEGLRLRKFVDEYIAPKKEEPPQVPPDAPLADS